MARRQDFDVFADKYSPKFKGIDHIFYQIHGKDLEYIMSQPSNYIWTLLEGDTGKLYICPGYHLVNRQGYLLTERPWEEGQRDYFYSN